MTLDTRRVALAAFQPGHLCAFAVPRLDLPAEAVRLLCGFCGILSLTVGHNVVHAVGSHLNPEEVHFVVCGKAFALDPFAVSQCVCTPLERVHALGSALAASILDLSVVLERAVVNVVQGLNEQPQVFGSVPRVYQHSL